MDNNVAAEKPALQTKPADLYDETIVSSPDVVDAQRVLLHEERLAPIKRNVQGRRAIITRNVVSVRKTIEVDVLHEELLIRYEPGDGSEMLAAEPDKIVIRLRAEEVEVVKNVRVVEEVYVSKQRISENQTLRGSVRREVLDVEEIGAAVPRTGA